MNRISLATLLVFGAFPALAQSSFFGEVLEVRITNVEVIVTSADGKPVKGLRREDFEVYEDGARKPITNFLEVQDERLPAELTAADDETSAAESPVEDMRGRSIVIFFDNASLHPLRRNDIIASLREFLASSLRPNDEVAILTWEHSLKAELEPTNDRAALNAALERVERLTTHGNRVATERDTFEKRVLYIQRAEANLEGKALFSQAINFARLYAMSVTNMARQRVGALKAVAASMRGVPGRKVLIFVTEGFGTNPAEDAFAWIDSQREKFAGDEGRMAMEEARDFELHGLIREVADVANSSGVTLYPIDGAGKDGGMNRTADASENPVVLFRALPVMQTAGATMNGIASETGGVALYGSTDWRLLFTTIASDLNAYYSLGYRSGNKRQDRLKKIVVKLKNKSYNVRSRRAVVEPSISSEMNDAVAAHLFRNVGNNDLAIRASLGAARPWNGSRVIIPLMINIPTDKLTLLPDGPDLTGSFSVFAAFLLTDGRTSAVARHPQSFRFPAESLSRRKMITLKLDLQTDASTSGISVGVMDDASRATGFAAVKRVE